MSKKNNKYKQMSFGDYVSAILANRPEVLTLNLLQTILKCSAGRPSARVLICRRVIAMSHSMLLADYAGDIVPAEAWVVLQTEPKAQLVDVRTTAEWNFVGLPDLSALGRDAHLRRMAELSHDGAQSGFRRRRLAKRWPGERRQDRGDSFPVPLGRALARRRHRDDARGLYQRLQHRGRL